MTLKKAITILTAVIQNPEERIRTQELTAITKLVDFSNKCIQIRYDTKLQSHEACDAYDEAIEN